MWRRKKRKSWMERMSNKGVLERVGERRKLLQVIRERKKKCTGRVLRQNCLITDPLQGLICGRRLRGRRKYKLIDDIKRSKKYADLIGNRTAWKDTM